MEDERPRAAASWVRFLLPAAVPLTIGGALGFVAALAHGQGGLNGLFGLAFAMAIFVPLLGITVLIGLGNLLRREGKGRTAARFPLLRLAC